MVQSIKVCRKSLTHGFQGGCLVLDGIIFHHCIFSYSLREPKSFFRYVVSQLSQLSNIGGLQVSSPQCTAPAPKLGSCAGPRARSASTGGLRCGAGRTGNNDRDRDGERRCLMEIFTWGTGRFMGFTGVSWDISRSLYGISCGDF